MKSPITTIVLGALTVLAFDTVTAVISRGTGLGYTWFAIGSTIICLLFGFLVARQSKWFIGGAGGAVLGLVDSTLGWALSWNIGPGRPEPEIGTVEILMVIVFVTTEGAVLGFVGGILSLIKRPNA